MGTWQIDLAVYYGAAAAICWIMTVVCMATAFGYSVRAARRHSQESTFGEAFRFVNRRNRSCFTQEGWEQDLLSRKSMRQSLFFGAAFVAIVLAAGLSGHFH